MQSCPQTETQSVYQHGLSVRDYTFDLIGILNGLDPKFAWKIPEWMFQYKNCILNSLLSSDIIEQYTTFHDCGKPYCLIIDENGKRHFPNHCQISYETWMALDGNQEIGQLILNDMTVHTMKADDIENFIKSPSAITSLIVALSEVHSNAAMFGGIDSVSFKIKWNQINKRGQTICRKLFGEMK